MNFTNLILRKIKTMWRTFKEILNVKDNNDVSVNSLLIGETTTANSELIADHFNIFSKCRC